VSDQDFFFDDDKTADKADKGTKAPAKKASGGSSRPTPKSSGAKSGSSPQSSSSGVRSISMTMAILFAVIGLLLGVIIGLFVGSSMNSTPAITAVPTTTGVQAPALSQDQMNAGQLPAGHPAIPGATGGSAATGGSSATKSK